MATADPAELLRFVMVLVLQADELALASVSRAARVRIQARLQLDHICLVIPHKHVVYRLVPTTVQESMHFLVAACAFERAEAFRIHR